MFGLLEFNGAPVYLLWFLGVGLTLARIAHAWGVITIYRPSPFRAIGFFLTWLIYLLSAIACLYYGMTAVLT